MKSHLFLLLRIAPLSLAWAPAAQGQSELSGQVAVEWRIFPRQAQSPEQQRSYLSVAVQPEYRYRWENGKQSFTFAPFARLDQHDRERTHFDIRELTWLKAGEGWELRFGIRKVFWGVTESQHLVDIINQTDLVENLDGEDKLGQPMINLALIRRWGTLDLFVLPGFRERKFPGRKGRLRTALPVDNERAVYESRRGRGHIDLAARWSRTFGEWDVGLSHFYGTSREPRLLPDVDRKALIPHYDLIHQTGLDAQWTKGKWLWKVEAIRRSGRRFGQEAGFTAVTGGFEYTLSNFAGSRADVGLIAEYLYDQRGNKGATPFQDDIMAGVCIALNDAQSAEALFGVIVDRRGGASFLNLEASRRLGSRWKFSLESRGFAGVRQSDLLYGFRRDSYLQLELAVYF
jgi:hypothetical protein